MEKQGFTARSEVTRGLRPVAQATVVAILTVAAQMVLTFPSTAGAQHLHMAQPESVGMSSKRFERLDAAMQRYIDVDMVAETVTLVARRGEVVHLKAQEHRYIEGNNLMPTDAIFVIMSMTKPIVSTALMMQISSYRHFTLRQDFPNLVMQAITDSFHAGAQAIRGYEPIERRE